MSSLRYQIFYRKYGVRLPQQVITPIMHDLNLLDLPMKSIYHYVKFDGIELGPPADEFLFRNIRKPIFVGSISEVGDNKGNPRRLAINENNLLRDYRGQNRRIRPLRDLSVAAKDPHTLVVYNYCFIAKMHKYIRSFYTEYFKWYNTFAAVMKNVASVTQETENQQFLVLGVPKIIPSLGQLNIASKSLTQTLMKVFKESNGYTLIEIWKWLGENRETSLLNLIPKNKLHLINLIYQESGKWTVINLGVLNSFRVLDESDSEEEYVIKSNVKLNPVQLQKRFLRFIMSVTETRTEMLKDSIKDENENDKDNPEGTQQIYSTDTDDDSDENPISDIENITISDQVEEREDRITVFSELDAETEEEYIARIQEEDTQLDEELNQLNEIASRHENDTAEQVTNETLNIAKVLEERQATPEEGVMNLCDRLAEEGLLTAGEYKRFNDLSQRYKVLDVPYPNAEGKSIAEFIQIKPEELLIDNNKVQFTESPSVLDKTMLRSSLMDLDTVYIKNILPKHAIAMVTAIQQAGIAVTDYNIEEVNDVLGAYEIHTVKITPVEGAPSTLNFKIPKVGKEGKMEIGGVGYVLRKQRGDVPIRKISNDKVALTSYYGKTFVNRGRKRSNDYGVWLQSKVMAKALDKTDPDIKSFMPGDAFDPDLVCARSYSALSMSYRQINARGYVVYFDQRDIVRSIPEHVLRQFNQSGNLVIGTNGLNYLILDPQGTIYTTKNTDLELFGTFEQFLNIVNHDAPVDFAELVVFGKEIPIGLILSYYLGLTNLLKLLNVNPRRVETGTRLNLGLNEFAVTFSDESLVLSRDDKIASMILAGFNDYEKIIKQFSIYSFDQKGVYLNVLESNRLSVRYLRELELMNQMFIDPITKQILEEMKEPQTFLGLLIRACELLLNDQHPDELDPRYMRIKGYERIPGAIYAEIVQSLRQHNGVLGRKSKRIEMNPYSVWKRITEDPAKNQISEINPIQDLKELEAVTYSGVGGRNKRSMVKSTRAFHKNDMGTISEATVDSSDVAINVFLSANPKIKSVLGLSEDFSIETDGATSLLSTSALLAPCSDQDDPKRVNFINIQNSHQIATVGYSQAYIKTGYETILPQRVGEIYAVIAKKPGYVKSISNTGIIVEYQDGELTGYEIGRYFGHAAGLIIPHEIVTPLKVNEVFEPGQAIIYNTGFFEPDFFDPKKLCYKNHTVMKTVLWESNQTLEDASYITSKAAKKLSTKITKVKNIVVNFDQTVSKLVKVGDEVKSESLLCIIQDAITANSQLFSDETIDTLKLVSGQTPRAHVKGKVEAIEVFYHGDKEDMSESLRQIADESDNRLKKKRLSQGKKPVTGSVDTGFRIDNNPLSLDTLAIRVYITSYVGTNIGDKAVFVNQMKTVISGIVEEPYRTEDGTELEAIFGAKSIEDRIVNSPYIIGTATTLLKLIAKKAIEIYKK